MAKTVFAALMQIPSSWLNKVFGATGHRHDGVDDDGHAPLDYAVDSGAANAYAAVLTPALNAHVPGLPIFLKIANANTHGAKTVSSLTRAGTTATATATGHGYSNNDWVVITGAGQAEYNGVFQISNITTNTFDYTVSGAPTTPATGAINATKAATFNPSALGAKPVVKTGGVALVPGDMSAGLIAILQFDGTVYALQNPVHAPFYYGADYGTANAYAVKLSPAPIARVTGMTVKFMTTNANTAGSTIDDGLGALAIKKLGGVALDAGDIPANRVVALTYNGTDWRLDPALVRHNHSDDQYGGVLGASAVSGLLGAWNGSSALDTVYQAATDLIVHYSVSALNGGQYAYAYTDSANPPNTIRGKLGTNEALGLSGQLAMHVKKGHYWKVTSGSYGAIYLNVIPIGS